MPDDTKKLREEIERLYSEHRRTHRYSENAAIVLLDNKDTILAALRAVEALPKTADGVPVIPQDADQRLWRIHDDKVLEVEADEYWQHRETNEWYVQDQWSYDVGGIDNYAYKVSDCYSTAEAAAAALASQPTPPAATCGDEGRGG